MRPTIFAFVLSAPLIAPTSGTELAQNNPYPYHMMWGGGWIMGPIIMLLFFAIVIFAVVLVVRRLWPARPPTDPGSDGKTAISILEERYARGEIEKEEFEEKKRVIGS